MKKAQSRIKEAARLPCSVPAGRIGCGPGLLATVLSLLCWLAFAGSAFAQTNLLVPLIDIAGLWRCNQSGQDLGTAWPAPGYNDALWPRYYALMYNESASLPAVKNTPLSLNSSTNGPVVTYYVRSHFTLTADPADVLALIATLLVEDGAVIYVNDAEAGRYNMPTGPVTSATLAATAVQATNYVMTNLDLAGLVPGDNVLAMEVHRANTNGGHVVIGLGLNALVQSPTALSVVQDVPSLTVTSGCPAQLTVGVSGSWPRYQWFKNSQPIPNATASSVSLLTTRGSDAGNYFVVVTNSLGSITSRVATLTVVVPTNAPATLDRIGASTLATDGAPGALMSFDPSTSGAWGVCGSVFTPAVSGAAGQFSFVFFGRYQNFNGTNNGPLSSFEDFQLELRVWTNGAAGFRANPGQPNLTFALGPGPTNPPAFGATTNIANGQVLPTYKTVIDLGNRGLHLDAGREYVLAPVFVKADATRLVRLSLSRTAGPADVYAGFNSATNTTTALGFAFQQYATALTVPADVPGVALRIAPFGSNFALSWPALSSPGSLPELWATTNLAIGPWAPLMGPLNTNFLVVTNAAGQQFFRLRMP